MPKETSISTTTATSSPKVPKAVSTSKAASKKTETPKTKTPTEVVFIMNDRDVPKREFSRKHHGKNFLDVANEFEQTNRHLILDRKDL